MKFTFLGTGTSHGVPMIGCKCEVCISNDPKNKRRRCSLYVVAAEKHLVFDTPPDFREQVLSFGVEHIDAVFLTHPHADHIFGFDDVRRFSKLQESYIPVYGSPKTIQKMRIIFGYVDLPSHSFGGVPRVRFTDISEPVLLDALSVTPLPVLHGKDLIYGYLVEAENKRLGYIPDCSAIPEKTFQQLKNMDVMILDGLRPEKHPTHFSTEESIEHLLKIGAKQSFITHLTHHVDHHQLQARVGDSITVPWDGLTVQL